MQQLSRLNMSILLENAFPSQDFFDLTDEEIGAMQIFAKKVAIAIKKAFPCIKVGQAVLGLEVPHAHIHLVPMQKEKDMLFSNPKLQLTPDEFKEIASKIASNIEKRKHPGS